jgi:hypothetical protein
MVMLLLCLWPEASQVPGFLPDSRQPIGWHLLAASTRSLESVRLTGSGEKDVFATPIHELFRTILNFSPSGSGFPASARRIGGFGPLATSMEIAKVAATPS